LPKVIPRGEIPYITQIEANGHVHNLGLLAEFRKHKVLDDFLPQNARLSLSWVHLNEGEVLQPHTHDTPSMIILCKGDGRVFGDLEKSLSEGDTVLIPPFQQHGFIGGQGGFWGLSVQFEGKGLYEDVKKPRVAFSKSIQDTLSSIKHENIQYEAVFAKSKIMKMIEEGSNFDTKKFLKVLYQWSTWFQKISLERFRNVSDDIPEVRKLVTSHFLEEQGHDHLLKQSIPELEDINDPILEACASWFFVQMGKNTEIERSIIMHLVLEKSGEIFHEQAMVHFSHLPYFNVHCDHDADHATMGYDILEKLLHHQTNVKAIENFKPFLKLSWNMMLNLTDRMAYLTQSLDDHSIQ